MKKIVRNGDVNLIEVEKMPAGIKKVKHKGSYVLAKGEATGSVHLLTATRPKDLEIGVKDEVMYYKVLEPARVTHTHDHEPLVIEPGIYKQVPEREMDHFAESIERRVQD